MQKLKNFFKGNKPTIMNGLFTLMLVLFISLFSLVLTSDDNNLIKVLSAVSALSLFAMAYVFGKNQAYKDHQVKKNNSARINNGEQVPEYRRYEEFAYYKPFLSAAAAFLPTIILLVLHAAGGWVFARGAAILINYAYFVPLANLFALNSPYGVLIGIFVMTAINSVSYILEGMRQEYLYKEMQKRRK